MKEHLKYLTAEPGGLIHNMYRVSCYAISDLALNQNEEFFHFTIVKQRTVNITNWCLDSRAHLFNSERMLKSTNISQLFVSHDLRFSTQICSILLLMERQLSILLPMVNTYIRCLYRKLTMALTTLDDGSLTWVFVPGLGNLGITQSPVHPLLTTCCKIMHLHLTLMHILE